MQLASCKQSMNNRKNRVVDGRSSGETDSGMDGRTNTAMHILRKIHDVSRKSNFITVFGTHLFRLRVCNAGCHLKFSP